MVPPPVEEGLGAARGDAGRAVLEGRAIAEHTPGLSIFRRGGACARGASTDRYASSQAHWHSDAGAQAWLGRAHGRGPAAEHPRGRVHDIHTSARGQIARTYAVARGSRSAVFRAPDIRSAARAGGREGQRIPARLNTRKVQLRQRCGASAWPLCARARRGCDTVTATTRRPRGGQNARRLGRRRRFCTMNGRAGQRQRHAWTALASLDHGVARRSSSGSAHEAVPCERAWCPCFGRARCAEDSRVQSGLMFRAERERAWGARTMAAAVAMSRQRPFASRVSWGAFAHAM
ncbi:hypothetical protein BD413DRAFT_199779 [Trametes elegans]|nr:hypothetical protein BD413DRAFT_199779 [Trametes elegans]